MIDWALAGAAKAMKNANANNNIVSWPGIVGLKLAYMNWSPSIGDLYNPGPKISVITLA
jgi:hypothetical protein